MHKDLVASSDSCWNVTAVSDIHPDQAVEALRTLTLEFAAFCQRQGNVTEADTRAKVIDQVLTDVLGWPESEITRETHVHDGYLDYGLLVRGRPYVVVEAKREGKAFELPSGNPSKTLKLSGALKSSVEAWDAVLQVRTYCDEVAARFAVATNGYVWIVFRAIREDMPWRNGVARIFPSLENIAEHFLEFWNLLSYRAVLSGSLDAEFGSPLRVQRRLGRVLDRLFNANLPLLRNRLNTQLQPLLKKIFEDIADQDEIEILQSCYVHSESLRFIADDLNCVITDAVPQFLKLQGAEEIQQGDDHAGRFETALIQAVSEPKGQLFLLLGGIGCGKTTFLKRYQRTIGKALLDTKSFYFHIDFLATPLDPHDMEAYVWRSILDQVRARYPTPYLESRANLRRAFAAEIEALRQTALRNSKRPEEFEALLSPYLEKWQQDLVTYVPRLLVPAQGHYHRGVVIFIDNVDQLSPAYQAQIFLLAQRVSRTLGAITIVSLREESYYSATIQKTFTAYSSRRFHIASPQFRKLIHSRIQFALRWLESQESQATLPIVPRGSLDLDRTAIADFLRIVEFSIFNINRNIARFIEAICFGNMRLALEMFTTFLVSGASDVDKMLRIYRRDGAYFVAFHEFVKSIMLGERRYYKESESPIINIFDCGPEKNSSHFTAIRTLRYLLKYRGQSSPAGQGYCELSRVVLAFEDIFDNREDLIRTLNRLLRKQLVEVDTRSTETVDGANSIRVTPAGWYYVRHLMHSFAYLDLVLQDTPLNDSDVEEKLRRSVFEVDNLTGREEEKLTRMQERFARVRTFLEYLGTEEALERDRYALDRLNADLSEPVVSQLVGRFESERQRIETRIRENRERFAEDIKQDDDADAPDASGDEDEVAD